MTTEPNWGPTKTCSKCGETKPVFLFHRRGKGADVKRSRCKECNGADLAENARTRAGIRLQEDDSRRAAMEEKRVYHPPVPSRTIFR